MEVNFKGSMEEYIEWIRLQIVCIECPVPEKSFTEANNEPQQEVEEEATQDDTVQYIDNIPRKPGTYHQRAVLEPVRLEVEGILEQSLELQEDLDLNELVSLFPNINNITLRTWLEKFVRSNPTKYRKTIIRVERKGPGPRHRTVYKYIRPINSHIQKLPPGRPPKSTNYIKGGPMKLPPHIKKMQDEQAEYYDQELGLNN